MKVFFTYFFLFKEWYVYLNVAPTPCERKTPLRIEWSHEGMDGMNKFLTHLKQECKEFHMSYMEFATKMDLWPSKTISLLHNFLGELLRKYNNRCRKVGLNLCGMQRQYPIINHYSI